MRVLLMVSPVPTHLMPLLPMVWALRGAGHEVLLAGQPDLAAVARDSGLPLAVIGHEEKEVEARRERRARGEAEPRGEHGSRAEPPWHSLAERWRARVADVLEPARELADRWQPDLILADPLEYASLIVGAARGVPVVHHRWGVDSFTGRQFARVQQALDGMCRAAVGTPLPAPDLVLDPCPPSLRHPETTPGLAVRFLPSNGPGTRPDWAVPPADGVRRLCLSLGLRTLALEGTAVVRSVMAPLGSLPGVETVATVGHGYRAELGALPPSVRLVDPAPLDLFLEHCSAVVHHGGSGTGLTAVVHGLPQLVLPQSPWTAEHGERIAQVGAGLTLPTEAEQCDPGTLTAAVRALLDDPRHRDATRELRSEMLGTPSPAESVAALVRLAAEGAPAH